MMKNQIRRYSIASLYYSDDDVIELVNKENCFCDYISNARDYLAIDNPNIDRLIHCFTLLGVCFHSFDYTELNKELFQAVYEGSLYENSMLKVCNSFKGKSWERRMRMISFIRIIRFYVYIPILQ